MCLFKNWTKPKLVKHLQRMTLTNSFYLNFMSWDFTDPTELDRNHIYVPFCLNSGARGLKTVSPIPLRNRRMPLNTHGGVLHSEKEITLYTLKEITLLMKYKIYEIMYYQ